MGERSLSFAFVFGRVHSPWAMNHCLLERMLERVRNKTVNKPAKGAADFASGRRLTVFNKSLIALTI
jgi:hypothetical protein